MARSYQRTIFANVSQVFGAAIADDLIAKNPCRSGTVRKPVPDPGPIIPWPAQWVAGVRDALPARFATLAAGAGLRQGEIPGLTPDDIDAQQGTVHVRRQVKLTVGNQPYLVLPKGRETRSVPVPASVVDAVLDHLTDLPARMLTLPWDRPDEDPLTVSLVLTSRESTPVNRHYFNAKIWKPALVIAGVPPTRNNGCHALYEAIAMAGEGLLVQIAGVQPTGDARSSAPSPTRAPALEIVRASPPSSGGVVKQTVRQHPPR